MNGAPLEVERLFATSPKSEDSRTMSPRSRGWSEVSNGIEFDAGSDAFEVKEAENPSSRHQIARTVRSSRWASSSKYWTWSMMSASSWTPGGVTTWSRTELGGEACVPELGPAVVRDRLGGVDPGRAPDRGELHAERKLDRRVRGGRGARAGEAAGFAPCGTAFGTTLIASRPS